VKISDDVNALLLTIDCMDIRLFILFQVSVHNLGVRFYFLIRLLTRLSILIALPSAYLWHRGRSTREATRQDQEQE
jgi:hypothetical protein